MIDKCRTSKTIRIEKKFHSEEGKKNEKNRIFSKEERDHQEHGLQILALHILLTGRHI